MTILHLMSHDNTSLYVDYNILKIALVRNGMQMIFLKYLYIELYAKRHCKTTITRFKLPILNQTTSVDNGIDKPLKSMYVYNVIMEWHIFVPALLDCKCSTFSLLFFSSKKESNNLV